MLPTEKSKDERFEIHGNSASGLEIDSRDFVVRVQRQAHRQIAALTMQPERDPPAGALAEWTVELFDVAEPGGEPSVKIGRFLRRKRFAHPRVVKLLDGGVIARVEQINNFSSDDGVTIGFFKANAGRDPLCDLRCGFPFVVQRPIEHQKEPNSNNSAYAENGDLPKGDLKFNRFNVGGCRHREHYWAQIGDVRFIQRLAGFGRMEQRLQLCFEGKKLFGPRPLIEPVDENVGGQRDQCKDDADNKTDNKIVEWRCPNEDEHANRERKQIPPQNRPQQLRLSADGVQFRAQRFNERRIGLRRRRGATGVKDFPSDEYRTGKSDQSTETRNWRAVGEKVNPKNDTDDNARHEFAHVTRQQRATKLGRFTLHGRHHLRRRQGRVSQRLLLPKFL